MTRSGSRLHAALTPGLVAVACVFALSLPAGAGAEASPAGGDGLSSRLAELSTRQLRGAPVSVQAKALSLPDSGPGSLLRDGARLYAEVRFWSGALARADRVRGLGIAVEHASRRLQTLTVAVRPSQLRALAALPGARSVHEVLTPETRAACPGGAVVSEGDAQLLAAAAREDFGVDGSGVEVGILSDSFDRDPGAVTDQDADVAAGDLPGAGNPCGRTAPVDVLDDLLAPSRASDEGRGMAQIVHDLAPGASISFASAFGSEASFAANIRSLADDGAGVLVDDVAWFEEPFFQDGPIAVAIGDVTAAGVAYLTAAGNDNLVDSLGRPIASWQTPEFRDSGSCPPQLEAKSSASHCMDFDPTAGVDDTFGITVEEDEELMVDLQWAEPWDGVGADIDAYLLDEDGKPLEEGGFPVGSYGDNVGDSGRPVEVFGWENTGPETEVQLAIDHCFGDGCNAAAAATMESPLKFILLENGRGVSATEYPAPGQGGDIVGPAVYGHAGSAAAIAVGAIPYFDSTEPEEFSSRGPVEHRFGPVRPAGQGPADPIVPPLTLAQPLVGATDCGRTSFFVPTGSPGVFRFCGTSAAAPHAAAVVALARQANPGLSPARIATDLRATARPLPGHEAAVGAGLVDARAMIEEAALPPRIRITSAPAAIGRDRQPAIAFEANRPVAFRCQFDGSAPFPCASPFRPDGPLADGRHGFVVSGVDVAGRSGNSPLVDFVVDTRPPRTSIASHPRRTVRSRRLRVRTAFRFRSDEPGSRFACRIDGGLFRFCPERILRRVGPGAHAVRVKAVDQAGNVDPSPAVFRFKVKRIGR